MEDFAGKSPGRKFQKFVRENAQKRLCTCNAKIGLLAWFAVEFLGPWGTGGGNTSVGQQTEQRTMGSLEICINEPYRGHPT